jgi:hypothetical protein
MMRILPIALVPLLLACGQGENTPGPGGVTAGEARALDEAAEMIEQRRLPPAALRPPTASTAPVQAPPTAAGPAN